MLTIRPTRPDELPVLLSLIEAGRRIMRSDGNLGQWADGEPSAATLSADIAAGHSYLCLADGRAVGTFALIHGEDPTYRQIYDGAWADDVAPYSIIHRIASLPGAHGVFRAVMDFAFRQTDNLRIDTHRDNRIMRHCLTRYGFRYCGIIYLQNGDERLAYQRLKTEKRQ